MKLIRKRAHLHRAMSRQARCAAADHDKDKQSKLARYNMQHAVAAQVLFESARALLKAGQQGSGTDLTLFLLEVWDGGDVPVDDDSRGPYLLDLRMSI